MTTYTIDATITVISEFIEEDRKTNEMIDLEIQLLKDGLPVGEPWRGGFTPDYTNAYILSSIRERVRNMVMADIAKDRGEALDIRVQTIRDMFNVWEYEV